MELLALHIYHLDEGEEADRVVQILREGGLGPDWRIERPTEATNAIFVPAEVENEPGEGWQIREQKLARALVLLRALGRKAIEAIRALDLQVAMRIVTADWVLPLSAEFVAECARLDLGIFIVNTRVRKPGYRQE